jgi:hypothetical protein
MTLARRLLLLWALLFWQGGFLFYGSVVVPVGSRILGSEHEQGFVTRSVTNYLNIAGAVALAFWGLDLLAEPGASRRTRWLLWGLLVLTLGLLAWLHVRLDQLLDPDQGAILDRNRFRALHRWYLRVSTAQWLGCVLLSALTVRAWTRGQVDKAAGDGRSEHT